MLARRLQGLLDGSSIMKEVGTDVGVNAKSKLKIALQSQSLTIVVDAPLYILFSLSNESFFFYLSFCISLPKIPYILVCSYRRFMYGSLSRHSTLIQ
jgi:hypothetical protein